MRVDDCCHVEILPGGGDNGADEHRFHERLFELSDNHERAFPSSG